MVVQTKWRDDNAAVVVPAMQMRRLLVLLRAMHLRDRDEAISVRRRAEMGWRGRKGLFGRHTIPPTDVDMDASRQHTAST